ncbi:MAG: alpha-1,2-fucosyltransferase [Bacteroidota bacterium]
MVAIRLEGRLGNQLFQYAFIYSSAKKLGTKFYIDQYIEPFTAGKYFNNLNKTASPVEGLFRIKGFKNIFSFHLRRLYYRLALHLFKLTTVVYDGLILPAEIKPENNTMYQGFFQSELFFAPFKNEIRNNLTLKSKFINEFKLRYGKLYQNNQIVTVHIRRTDYLHLGHLNLGGNDLSLPIGYYKKAIENFSGQNVTFVFISDDVPFVEENFKHVTSKIISTDTEIMDFQHLINADACIISNSTFSWWGAWLNNKPNKKVFAPKYAMGWRIKQDYPKNMYPTDWEIVDFLND